MASATAGQASTLEQTSRSNPGERKNRRIADRRARGEAIRLRFADWPTPHDRGDAQTTERAHTCTAMKIARVRRPLAFPPLRCVCPNPFEPPCRSPGVMRTTREGSDARSTTTRLLRDAVSPALARVIDRGGVRKAFRSQISALLLSPSARGGSSVEPASSAQCWLLGSHRVAERIDSAEN